MKKIITIAFFAAAVLLLSDSSARAQHGYRLEKQIKFAPGKSSATVKGRIANRLEAHEYTLKARQGQMLYIVLNAANAEMTFTVLDAKGELVDEFSGNDDWDKMGELPAAGEYKINVSTARGKGSYTLFVEIKDKGK